MKKLFLSLLVFLFLSLISEAQEKALGLRFGKGGEISYLHPLEGNRVELDVGAWSYGVNVTAVHDWVFYINDSFNWFTGVGASLGADNYRGAIGLLGNIGVEYNLSIPLMLTVDYRPVYFFGETGFKWDGLAFGVRYRF